MKKISILRGINVSGQKKIKMFDLKQLYEDLGFSEVVTYIQSGNVVFESEISDTKKLKEMIEKGITDQYDFGVPVIIRKHLDFKQIIEGCPFGKIDLEEGGTKVLLTLLAQTPNDASITQLMAYVKTPEQLVIKDKSIYLHCPNGYGRSKLSNVFIENKLKVQATTRNWKTVEKLFEISKP